VTHDLEKQFHQEMLNIGVQASKIGYRPTYFLRMVQTLGGLAAAGQLLDSSTISEGFTRLFELNRLDLSVEAVALKPVYRNLFSEEQLQCAHDRLVQMRYFDGESEND